MFHTQVLKCPVCTIPLGYLTEEKVCAFVCGECRWIFTWDKKGKLGIPVKVVVGKKPDPCDCEGCRFREEEILRKKNENRYI